MSEYQPEPDEINDFFAALIEKIFGDGPCPHLGSGNCCDDKHFDSVEVVPALGGKPICKMEKPPDMLTTDKTAVTCKGCIEWMKS